jgi:NDP-sugar pyrophosphorylase family protein
MIGVIVVPGSSPLMHGLDAKRSAALLPLGDRPMLQRIVESLVAQKITNIELIVDHAPQSIEALLGNGDRWGGRFRYHLVSKSERPYRSLKIMPGLKTEPWILIHAVSYPGMALPVDAHQKPVLFYGASSEGNSHQQWKGTAIFPSDAPIDLFSNLTSQELQDHLEGLAAKAQAEVVDAENWLDIASPAAFLRSQTLLLDRRLDGQMISGTEREPGVWISRNVAIHPSVKFIAPVYVGPDSRINRGVRVGPNAVIEGECIVDSSTSIENSFVAAGSYIGEGLELDNAIVDHNLLINVRLGTSVNIAESFLLGGLKRHRPQPVFIKVFQSLMAMLLFVVLLPLFVLALVVCALQGNFFSSTAAVQIPANGDELQEDVYRLPCIGTNAWTIQRRAGWGTFTLQFLPGLLAVAKGHLGFVGLPPRSPEEIQALSTEWRELYLGGIAGLITEVALADSDPNDATQRYLADAYYSVRRSFPYNLKLASRYFLRLLVPSA